MILKSLVLYKQAGFSVGTSVTPAAAVVLLSAAPADSKVPRAALIPGGMRNS